MKTLIDARSEYVVTTPHGSVAGAADGEAERLAVDQVPPEPMLPAEGPFAKRAAIKKRELLARADQEIAGSSSGTHAGDLQNSRADQVSELVKNMLAFDSIFPWHTKHPIVHRF